MRPCLPICLLTLVALPSHADIYKCVEGGHTTYSNVQTKGCVKLNLEPISTVPSAKPAARTPTPGGFPKVEEGAQRARDNDRRRILEQEQAAEQKSLEEARRALADAETNPLPSDRNVGGSINQGKLQERIQPLRDEVQLHERNLEALNKELSNLR